MSFFVVKGSEDGTQITELQTEVDLKQYIEDYGITGFRSGLGETFGERDTNYWGEKECLIINGNILIPKPKEVVKDWEF